MYEYFDIYIYVYILYIYIYYYIYIHINVHMYGDDFTCTTYMATTGISQRAMFEDTTERNLETLIPEVSLVGGFSPSEKY